MTKILAWLKKYALWILGGVIAVGALFVAISKKTLTLSMLPGLEKNKEEILGLGKVREEALNRQDEYDERALKVDAAIRTIDKDIERRRASRKAAKEARDEPMSAKDISAKLNARYGSDG